MNPKESGWTKNVVWKVKIRQKSSAPPRAATISTPLKNLLWPVEKPPKIHGPSRTLLQVSESDLYAMAMMYSEQGTHTHISLGSSLIHTPRRAAFIVKNRRRVLLSCKMMERITLP